MNPPDCPEPERLSLISFNTLADARTSLLLARAAGEEPLGLTLSVDETGHMADGGDVRAALIVLRAMGVEQLGLDGPLPEEKRVKLLKRLDEVMADSDIFALASEQEAFFVDSALLELGEMIECGPHLDEAILAEEGNSSGVLTLFIENDDGLDDFAKNAYLINAPLCLRCADLFLLEHALRLYPGRVLFDNSEELPDDELARLSRLYGMLVL